MEEKQFVDQVVSVVSKHLANGGLSDHKVEAVTTVKANDAHKGGICIRKPGYSASPIIYLDGFFEKYKKGEPIDAIAKAILEIYEQSSEETQRKSFSKEIDFSYENIKDKLRLRIYDSKNNEQYLSTHVHKTYTKTGLAIVPEIRMCDENGEWSAAITNDLAQQFQYDENKLITKALNSNIKGDPPLLFALSSCVEHANGNVTNLLDTGEISNEEAYVLTSTSGEFGSYIMVFPGYMKKIAASMGPFYIIPSSRHEIILIPEAMKMEPEYLLQSLRSANSTVVEPDIVLSDDLFHFSLEHGLKRII